MVVATKGAYTGKPRPALIVQSDIFLASHGSISVCPITSDCIDAPLFRITLPPGSRTGLAGSSQVMVDKIVSVPKASIGKTIGNCDDNEMLAVDDALRLWLALD